MRAYASGRVAYARDAFDGLQPDGQGHRQRVRRLSGGGAGASRVGKARNTTRTLGQADAKAFRPVDVLAVQARRRRLTQDVAGDRAALLGRSRDRGAAARRSCRSSTSAACINSSGASGSRAAALDEFLGWAKQELRPVMRRMLALCEEQDILQAAGGLRLLEGGRPGQRPHHVRRRTARPSFAASPCRASRSEDGECIADFFRDVDDAERDVIGLQVVTVGQKASDTGARVVRGEPLPGLPLSARAVGGDGRGDGGIHAQAHPRRTRFRGRG